MGKFLNFVLSVVFCALPAFAVQDLAGATEGTVKKIDAVVGENALRRDPLGHTPGHCIEAHGFSVGLTDANFCVLVFQHPRRQQHSKPASNEHRLAVAHAEGLHALHGLDQLGSNSGQINFGFGFKQRNQIFRRESFACIQIEARAKLLDTI